MGGQQKFDDFCAAALLRPVRWALLIALGLVLSAALGTWIRLADL